MSKLLTTLLAATFAVATLTPVAFAAKHEAAEKLAAACKGKKPGDVVKVDGKDVKCPAPKK
jgi:Spy/CpxP family protein refolding chaperone